ncbi:MAG: formate/nitrite transporter family protein [Synergistaceae bacterium]|nr:formate/nitrite transporter family protein [Synergistaceae bacterium]
MQLSIGRRIKVYSSPSEIADSAVNIGIRKAGMTLPAKFLLGILAGAFIAFGSQAASLVTHTITDPAAAKLTAGLIFPAGLIAVLMAGAELFTGNCLMIIPLVKKRITLTELLSSWLIVYLGNFAGSLIVACLVSLSGQWNMSAGLLGAFTLKVAAGKISLSFTETVTLGILCNWLVCLAVWMSFGAKDGITKAICAFFPVWVFIASGFEHSVANMYYIPAGIIAKSSPLYVAKAIEIGVSQANIDALGWVSMFTRNLIPVTIGNIIGGCVFVGLAYWYVYLRGEKSR